MGYKSQKGAYAVYFLLGMLMLVAAGVLSLIWYFSDLDTAVMVMFFYAPFFVLFFLLFVLIALGMSFRKKFISHEREASGMTDAIALGLTSICYFGGWVFAYSSNHFYLLEVDEANALVLVLIVLAVPYAFFCINISRKHMK